jgi:hypothetical protein
MRGKCHKDRFPPPIIRYLDDAAGARAAGDTRVACGKRTDKVRTLDQDAGR